MDGNVEQWDKLASGLLAADCRGMTVVGRAGISRSIVAHRLDMLYRAFPKAMVVAVLLAQIVNALVAAVRGQDVVEYSLYPPHVHNRLGLVGEQFQNVQEAMAPVVGHIADAISALNASA